MNGEQRRTSAFQAATLWGEAILAQYGVIACFCSAATRRLPRLVLQQNDRCCADREMRKRLQGASSLRRASAAVLQCIQILPAPAKHVVVLDRFELCLPAAAALTERHGKRPGGGIRDVFHVVRIDQ